MGLYADTLAENKSKNLFINMEKIESYSNDKLTTETCKVQPHNTQKGEKAISEESKGLNISTQTSTKDLPIKSIKPSQTPTSLPTQVLIPETDPLDLMSKMDSFLTLQYREWGELMESCVKPYPMSISKSTFELLKRLHGAIHRALVAVVENYEKDERLRKAFPLPDEVLRVLRPAMGKKPFRVGNFRPDFLYDSFGDIWLCEINARFSINGFMFTYVGSRFIKSLSSTSFDLINEFDEVPDAFLDSLQINSLEKKGPTVVGVLIKREPAEDLGWLKELFAETGLEFIFVDPSNLVLVTTEQGAALMDSSTGKITKRWFSQLHQDEILALPEEIAMLLFDPEKNIVVNDIRTVFFCHDKRMLSVITNINLMREYLQLEDLEVIRDHVVPSYTVGHLEEGLLASLDKDEWLVKPSLLGKGLGIVFGKNVTEEAWKATLASSPTHVLQRYVRSNKQRLLIYKTWSDSQNENLKDPVRYEDHLVVGTMLCSNDRFLGPGVFRSSADDELFVYKKSGSFYIPVLEAEPTKTKTVLADYQKASFYQKFLPRGVKPFPISDDCCFFVSSPTNLSDATLYQKSLIEHGIALIYMRFSDPDSAFMSALVSVLGKPNPNSKCQDTLWDVRYDPKQSQSHCARSHSLGEFTFHTDCSFETIPPRYLALHALHADRYGGGLSELVDGRAILGDLTPEDILALKTAKYRFEVPKEFHKDLSYIEGPILSQDGACIRFREDIITPPQGDDAAAAAFIHLKKLLETREHAAHLFLPDNTIILIDNGRFFHGRSKIIDHSRHLRRIRFHPNDASLIPVFGV